MNKDAIKLLAVMSTRALSRAFFFMPIKRNRLLFNSYAGRQYSCNPKYITEYILKNAPGAYDLVWAFNDPEQFADLRDRGITLCRYKSLKYYYYRMTSRILICNSTMGTEVAKRKKQLLINTWHGGGGGYKKGGMIRSENKGIKGKFYMLEKRDTDVFCTSSETSYKNTVIRAFDHHGQVIKGTPRNDMFVNADRDDIKQEVRKYFGLSADTRIALYAPTYRNDQERKSSIHDYGLDIARMYDALRRRFGGEWIVLVRYHYFLKDRYVLPDIAQVKDATLYPDMQDLLYTADVLVTDYSSSIWDFSFSYKPCFLFCTDLEEYRKNSGLNKPIEEWGFPLALTNDQLERAILQFDQDAFSENMKRHHDENGSFEDGKASERVFELIEQFCS